jgi:hypothetical protein
MPNYTRGFIGGEFLYRKLLGELPNQIMQIVAGIAFLVQAAFSAESVDCASPPVIPHSAAMSFGIVIARFFVNFLKTSLIFPQLSRKVSCNYHRYTYSELHCQNITGHIIVESYITEKSDGDYSEPEQNYEHQKNMD